MASFQELMGGLTFTFLIGEQETPFQIHPKFIQTVSEPLWKMMTNGMEETVNTTAKLPATDPETFALFCEYAYTKSYTATGALAETARITRAFDLPFHGLKYYSCLFCRESAPTDETRPFPFCHSLHKTTALNNSRPFRQYCGCCGICTKAAVYTASLPALCSACEVKQKNASIEDDGGPRIAGTLNAVEIAVGAQTYAQVRRVLKDDISVQVICHARLHVFADMYLAEELKQLTLHKLHQDLIKLKPTQENSGHLIEMLSYICEHTNADDDGDQASLRSLACMYTAENAKELIKSLAFQELLNRGGSFNTEIFQALLKRR